eukprot:TRINITY_DN6539_c0_g1_i2.p1 TRINITY_DN6539_c0_g1~~TRINITY_DN6539_c0_g1_i2.p1  ORF type:complete len:383 (-),score=89.61 TRINITY_DN6539_c0_g1_i2:66-1214(-)
MKTFVFLLLALIAYTQAAFYSENFDGNWESRWVQGEVGDNLGKFVSGKAPFYETSGIKTSEDARFYRLSSAFESFSNKDKPLVLQYTVANPQTIDCGGGYIKLHPSDINQKEYQGETPYNVMFGPDFCGSGTRRCHLIFNYKGENHLIRDQIPLSQDDLTHLYTMILRPDNTFEVLVDNEQVRAGNLADDFDMLPPKQINDPSASKPADWVDEAQIADPEDKKPEGWDDIPAEIADPDAAKPEDWDDELDGEWERPMIRNPEYKGEWRPKMIPNPDYKGEWVHPQIDNPEYKYDPNLYLYETNGAVGFELWQVKSGTVFGDILVTDNVEEATKAAEVVMQRIAKEKEAYEKDEEEKRKALEEEREKAAQELEEDLGDETDEL